MRVLGEMWMNDGKRGAGDGALTATDAATATGYVLGAELRACGVDLSFTPVLDLDYHEDHQAEVDMNVVMTGSGKFVEVQGTAEGAAFSRDERDSLPMLAEGGIQDLIIGQQAVRAQPAAPLTGRGAVGAQPWRRAACARGRRRARC